jgi:hypothetical protein
MDNNKELLQALDGIRLELKALNNTLSGMAAQQNRPTPRASFSDSPTRSAPPARSSARPSRSSSDGPGRSSAGPSRPSSGPGRTGGYKRKSDDGELTGYGAEMSSRFPQKRGPAKGKGKPPAKKGSGYPKKPR